MEDLPIASRQRKFQLEDLWSTSTNEATNIHKTACFKVLRLFFFPFLKIWFLVYTSWIWRGKWHLKTYFPIRGTFVMCTTLSLVGRFGQMVKKQTPCIFSWLFWKQSPAKSGEGVLNSAVIYGLCPLWPDSIKCKISLCTCVSTFKIKVVFHFCT